jgi:hypothetical protein
MRWRRISAIGERDLICSMTFVLTGGFEIRVDLFAAVEIKRRASVNAARDTDGYC